MTTVFAQAERKANFNRYREQWENALLSLAIEAQADLSEEDRKEVRKAWMIGLFNAHASHQHENNSHVEIEWAQSGPTHFDCIYTAPYGLKCSLARAYKQPDGSWAAMVIAGHGEDQYEAISKAEWAIARLTSFG